MTPLISEMVKLVPEPETAYWFDLGSIAHDWATTQLDWNSISHMPYQRMCCVFCIPENNTRYVVTMQAINANTIIAAFIMAAPGKPTLFSGLHKIAEHEGRVTLQVNHTASEKYVIQLSAMLAFVTERVHTMRTAHYPSRRGTAAQQAKRQRHGKAPLFDWHTVTVAASTVPIKAENRGGTHVSPRLHDRRGHWRKCSSGKVVWVRNCKVGNASRGVVFKDYKMV